MCHGKDDSMVVVDAVELSKNCVSEMTVEMGGRKDLYQTKIYSGLEHAVLMKEFRESHSKRRRGSCNSNSNNVDPSAMSVKEDVSAIVSIWNEKRQQTIKENGTPARFGYKCCGCQKV